MFAVEIKFFDNYYVLFDKGNNLSKKVVYF